MSTLSLHGVSKSFGDGAVLSDIELCFPEQAITAVIGPSGCGKSTLLRLCNGLLRPDSGRVRIFGADIDYSHLPALRRRLGYAVQGTALLPHLTARDNICLMARLEGWSDAAIDARLQQLLELSRLDAALLTRYPHHLSGGQQQRVGLCRALMLRPEVLLLDEPFAAIDPITRADIHRQLLALQRAEPRTVILVTHDMREALDVAEHLLVMRDGHIVARRNTRELRSRAQATAPEALLGELLRGEDQ